MIFLKTDEEVELMRASNILLGKTYAEVAKAIKPGVTTAQLDKDVLPALVTRIIPLPSVLRSTKWWYTVFPPTR